MFICAKRVIFQNSVALMKNVYDFHMSIIILTFINISLMLKMKGQLWYAPIKNNMRIIYS